MENDIQVVTEQPKELNLELAERQKRLLLHQSYCMLLTGMLAPAGEYLCKYSEISDATPHTHAIFENLNDCRDILVEFNAQLVIEIAEAFKPQE